MVQNVKFKGKRLEYRMIIKNKLAYEEIST